MNKQKVGKMLAEKMVKVLEKDKKAFSKGDMQAVFYDGQIRMIEEVARDVLGISEDELYAYMTEIEVK